LLDFWSLGQLHPKDLLTRVPTQVTCQIFKEQLRRWDAAIYGCKGRRKGREV
jgi:hypothetical protein